MPRARTTTTSTKAATKGGDEAATKPEKTDGDAGPGGLPVVLFQDAKAWETWLEQNRATSPGLWLRLAKKGSGIASVTYAEALEVALCHGWIDGQKASLDEGSWLQRFTRRGKRSIWSKINRQKAEALIACGRMSSPGLEEVTRAKEDGRWDDAYDSPSTATVPPELQAELDRSPRAKAFFAKLESRNRYAILWRIQTAKKPETKTKRIQELVGMLERGEKLYP